MASATSPIRRIGDRSVRREFEAYKRKLDELIFFTEDFRENQMQITAKVVTNLDLLNVETKHIYTNKQHIERVEAKVDRMDATLNSLLDHLGIEKKPACECGKNTGFVMHHGVDVCNLFSDDETVPSTAKTRIKIPDEVADKPKVMKEAGVCVGIQVETELSDFSIQTTPIAEQGVPKAVQTECQDFPRESQAGASASPLDYIAPTPSMLKEARHNDAVNLPPSGAYNWKMGRDAWDKLMDGDETTIQCKRPLLLPAAVGGAKIDLCLTKTMCNEDVFININGCLINDHYNRKLNLPQKVWVKAEVKKELTGEYEKYGIGGLWLDQFGNDTPCVDVGPIDKDVSPTLRLTFFPV